MDRQKSAEAIVGVSMTRRAEHEVPRVGGGISRKPMKAEADRAGQAGMADTGRNRVEAAARAEADMATRKRTKAEVRQWA